MILTAEIIRRHGMAGRHQLPVQGRIGEGIIRASHQLAQRLHLGPAQVRTTMSTAVVKGRNPAIRCAVQDRLCPAHRNPPHRAGGRISQPPHHHPLPRKQRRHLASVPAVVEIDRTRAALRDNGQSGVTMGDGRGPSEPLRGRSAIAGRVEERPFHHPRLNRHLGIFQLAQRINFRPQVLPTAWAART